MMRPCFKMWYVSPPVCWKIRIGRQNAANAEVLAAALAAQCDEFISALPQGYQTVLGKNGSILSGGERQCISITHYTRIIKRRVGHFVR